MKRLIFIVMLFLPLLGHSQAFFKAVDKSIISDKNDRGVASVWLVRPAVTISAMSITFGEQTTVEPLSSVGTGISYSHFIEQNGEPYQNVSVNLLVLFGTEVAEVSPLELSVAGTVSLWQYLSLGAGFNFMDHKVFLLTGVAINFNGR